MAFQFPQNVGGKLFDRITGRIFVSGELNNVLIAEALRVGITHIMNVASELNDAPFIQGRPLVGAKFPTFDDRQEKTWMWFSPAIPWALDVIAKPRTLLLVHCKSGIHRSTSMIYAIMRAQGFSSVNASTIILHNRAGAELLYQNDAERELRKHGYIIP